MGIGLPLLEVLDQAEFRAVMAHELGHLRNQAERAKAYRVYIEDAAANPYCVGAHWFTLYDESALGRRPVFDELTDLAADLFGVAGGQGGLDVGGR